ncbi:MAG: fimbrillin family protein [Alistipes sp.]|nr:fimbrillin family protein [Alistipes sp.]
MKQSIYISLLLALLLGFVSCQRDFDEPTPETPVERTEDLPIQLEVSIADLFCNGPATRGIEQAKRTFSYGDPETGEAPDIIHVISKFWWEEDGETKHEQRYCALEYTEDGSWVPRGAASFAWPNDAEWADFEAYYIQGSTGELTSNVDETAFSAARRRFSDLTDGEDPLYAIAERKAGEPGVRYGHTVKLTFEHILTHLTLIQLEAGIDDDLVLRIEKRDDDEPDTFNNAFQLKLIEKEAGKPELDFSYFVDKEELGDLEAASQVQAPTELVRDWETRAESRQAGFFLEPERTYNHFTIYYASNGIKHIEYNNSDPESKRKLLRNNRYTFDVKKSSGVSIFERPEQKWDESDTYAMVVDAGKFLQAIYSNSSYSEVQDGEEIPILERTNNPVGTLLLRNIYFATPYYHVFTYRDEKDADGNPIEPYDFVPSVGGDNIFDGGYHYIKGLCCPLFYENYGTIKNLGLADVTIGSGEYGEWASVERYNGGNVNAPYDYSRTGALTTNNVGTVQNIRVKNLTVNVSILSDDEQENHDAGALVGINEAAGHIDQVYLNGQITLLVQKYATGARVPTVNIGGLAGQNLGTMTRIEQLVDNSQEANVTSVTISVINKLNYNLGAYYVGGLVGNNTGKLTDIMIPTAVDGVTVDCSDSFGMYSYLGGIAGMADSANGNEISSCLIGSGLVKAGITRAPGDLDSFSYTGGMIGVYSERTHFYNCTAFFSVEGSNRGFEGDGVGRATGGIIGLIKGLESASYSVGKMHSLAFYGDLEECTNVGSFAGEVPKDRTWDDYKDNVDVKSFDKIGYIGSYTN